MRNANSLEAVRPHSQDLAVADPSSSTSLGSHGQGLIETSITRRGKWEEPIPLSYAQERMWFLDQLGQVGAAYNVPLAVRLEGYLDVGALERSLSELVRRHETLRTRFEVTEGVPYQRIDPAVAVQLNQVDLTHPIDSTRREHKLNEWVRREQLHHFDLQKGPLLRAVLLKLDVRGHVLLLTLHHIISDAWSLGILRRELGELYRAHSQNEPSPLPDLEVQYADYTIWQRRWLRGEMLQSQLSYWKSRLLGAPPQLELPTDRPRPPVASFDGAELRFELTTELTRALRGLAREEGATLFMVCLAAFQVLLSRWTGQQDIVVGSPTAGRVRREIEGLIGFFVNTLVLRTQLSWDMTFRELLGRIKEEVALDAYENQDLPFETLVKELRPERDLARQPLFQVMLALQPLPEERLALPGLIWNWTRLERTTAHFDITLYLYTSGSGITCVFEYVTEIFDRETIERMASHYRTLLEGVSQSIDCPIHKLPLLSRDEERRLIVEWNATAASYIHSSSVHQLFEEQVKRTPDKIAVAYADDSLTYAELDRRADQVALELGSQDIGTDEVVGLCTERRLEMVVGLLGILKAGGASMPLDPNYPFERILFMLEDAKPRVVLTQETLVSSIAPTRAKVITLDKFLRDTAALDRERSSAAEQGVSAGSLVYLIYTSGSTGRPKGTAMSHGAMVNLIEWHRKNLPCKRGTRVLQFAALSFDVAFQESFSTLCTGGALILLEESIRRDARALLEFMSTQSIQRLFVPPVMLQALAESYAQEGMPSLPLEDVIAAGEQLRITPEIVSLFERLPGCRLHNHYGPTETHVVTALTLAGNPREWPMFPRIGSPIWNTQIYILDAGRGPVPIGVSGEIYVGGSGVARGYKGRPGLTADRFVADPFTANPGNRMYRTGDRARWSADGSLEYLGRGDDQVKIRGYRIELGEIEAEISRHERVRDVAVVAREDSKGEKRLVAYITWSADGGVGIEELRTRMKAVLPEYMVPSAFVILESMPLTPSGKLDRRALPMPELSAYSRQRYEAPIGQLEVELTRIWQELLHVQSIGRTDSFFDLGGHSLLAVKALFKVNQVFGVDLKVADIYRSPTIGELAARVSGDMREDELVDLSREAVLDSHIAPASGRPRVPAKGILLTGATGFVGRFLLAQLLKDTDATIYCVIRAPTAQRASARLRNTLLKWDLWRDDYEPRIAIVLGDLRLPRLGVDEPTYESLSKKIDSIFHCATSMNHLETYSMAKLVNVESVRELLKLATHQRPKVVNHISTLGIFSTEASAMRVVDETTSIDLERHRSSRGYVASKWVAEKIVMVAAGRGIPCNIFRLGFVWADSKQGRFDELQRAYRIIKSSLLAGCGIKNYKYVAPTPVDYVARAVIFLATQHSAGQGVFHISLSDEVIENMFEQCNEITGGSLELKPYYNWIHEMKRLHENGRSMPIVPLVQFAFSMDEASFYQHLERTQTSSTRFDCNRTRLDLELAGISPPSVDSSLLEVCVKSMIRRDRELREFLVRGLCERESHEIDPKHR